MWTVLADRIRRSGAKSVLDIGCGPGQFAACLFDMAGIETYTGLDFSAEAIRMGPALVSARPLSRGGCADHVPS